MVKKYDKLIRDKIPEIISNDGKKAVTRVLSDKEYLAYLNKKLLEETNEYLESFSLEELADLQEVINAIIKAKGSSLQEFDGLREKKRSSNGGFDKKLLLLEVDDQADTEK